VDLAANRQEVGPFDVQVGTPTALTVSTLSIGNGATIPTNLVLMTLFTLFGGLLIRKRRRS
jgi:hypothetical protein